MGSHVADETVEAINLRDDLHALTWRNLPADLHQHIPDRRHHHHLGVMEHLLDSVDLTRALCPPLLEDGVTVGVLDELSVAHEVSQVLQRDDALTLQAVEIARHSVVDPRPLEDELM